MKLNIPYDYIVQNIGTKHDPAYKAIIPALNCIVYGDTVQELEEGITGGIKSVIESKRKKRLPVPVPDRDLRASGRLLVRMEPRQHARLAREAKAHGKSLNSYINERLAA